MALIFQLLSLTFSPATWQSKKFDALLAGDAVEDNERQQLMAYVLDWYAIRRGTYFVKHLKGNSGNHMKKLIDSQATRTKVANAVHQFKIVSSSVGIGTTCNMKSDVSDNSNGNISDTIKHKLLWQTAAVSVLEYANHEVEDNSSDNE
jgi:hypothetical protein